MKPQLNRRLGTCPQVYVQGRFEALLHGCCSINISGTGGRHQRTSPRHLDCTARNEGGAVQRPINPPQAKSPVACVQTLSYAHVGISISQPWSPIRQCRGLYGWNRAGAAEHYNKRASHDIDQGKQATRRNEFKDCFRHYFFNAFFLIIEWREAHCNVLWNARTIYFAYTKCLAILRHLSVSWNVKCDVKIIYCLYRMSKWHSRKCVYS